MSVPPPSRTGHIQALARGAGVLSLLVMAGGVFVNFGVRNTLVDSGNAAATASHIAASLPLYRAALAAELLTLFFNTVFTIVVYELLKPVNKGLALLSAALGLMTVAGAGVDVILDLAPLLLTTGAIDVHGLGTSGAQALTLFFLSLNGASHSVILLFAGTNFFLLGLLIFRSGFLPRTIGVMFAIAGPCALTQSLSSVLSPAFDDAIFPYILLPALVAQLSLSLWLIVMGVNAARWLQRSAQSLVPSAR
jgi:hypothetical protein